MNFAKITTGTLKKTSFTFIIFTALSISLSNDIFAAEIDWKSIRPTTITMFYPGMASMEFLISDDHRLGGRNIKQGKKNCRRCHLSKKGELDLKADEIASGTAKMKRSRKLFEDHPIKNKKGVLLASIKTAYDREYIYMLLSWPSAGKGWSKDADSDEIHPDRVSIQLNKRENYFRRYGCFITCHNDLNTMPLSPSKESVKANSYYARINRDDVRLYAYYTRDGAWNKMKSHDKLSGILKDGGLMDLWSVKLENNTASPMDGWVFEDRRWEKENDLEANATWSEEDGGMYTVLFKRKLTTPSVTDIQLKDGDIATIAVSIHDDNTNKRRHYVSFPMTVGLGQDGDITAKRLR
jgi:cytochrome c-type protein NapC